MSLHGTALYCLVLQVDADAEGLLPEWVVYHELVATGRVFLSKVGRGGTPGHWPCLRVQ